jgi:hypothetical protein
MRSRCSYDSSGLALVDLLSSRPHSPAIAGALSLYQREHKTAGLRALAACKATASQPHLIICRTDCGRSHGLRASAYVDWSL